MGCGGVALDVCHVLGPITVVSLLQTRYTNELSMPEVSRALAMYDIAAGGGAYTTLCKPKHSTQTL